MTALLTENLPLMAGAPTGIKKLRELILELAVRGKLVPQDPRDEPASELLKRIAEEKAQLVAEGKLKKQKPLAKIAEEEKPFAMPANWEWVRLDALLKKIGAGSTPLGGKQAYVADGVKFLRSQNVWNKGLRLNEVAFIPEETHQKMSGTHVEAGDLLFNITGASIGRCAAVPTDFDTGNVSQHVTIIRPVSGETQPFLHAVLVSQLVQKTVMDVQVGVSREGLSIGKLTQFLIPFPPEAEQHRIVAKVDELMALCDRLEAQQAGAESAHARLVQALLDSLTQANDAPDFATSWQRLAEHFQILFTTESSIDALKQTLLQLAVIGKMVAQDPNDEPASELLEKIAEESTRLVAKGKAKKGNVKAETVANGVSGVELPAAWTWTTFDDLINPEYPVAYGVLVPGPDVADGIPFVRIADLDLVAPPQKPEKSISPEVDRQFERTRIRGGEILMGVVGSIGKLGIAPASWAGANIARAICRLVPSDHVSKNYIIWLLQSDLMRNQFLGDTRTLAQPTLNVGLIRNASTPLPPIAEQHRIVAKVDQLMSLCDQLKARLSQARQLNEQLASTLVERAID